MLLFGPEVFGRFGKFVWQYRDVPAPYRDLDWTG